jgi:hypothetical protein
MCRHGFAVCEVGALPASVFSTHSYQSVFMENVACHYNSTGGIWARRHKRFVRVGRLSTIQFRSHRPFRSATKLSANRHPRQRNIVTMLRRKLSLSRHKSIDSVSRLLLRSSSHNVARLAGHESFDIVDQLIRQNLHSLAQAMCGVIMKFGRSRFKSTLPAVGGSLVRTSKRAVLRIRGPGRPAAGRLRRRMSCQFAVFCLI